MTRIDEMGMGKTPMSMTGKTESQLKYAQRNNIRVVFLDNGKLKFKASRFNSERNQTFGAWYATSYPLKFTVNYWFSDRKWYFGAYNLVYDSYVTIFYLEVSQKDALKLIRGK